MHDAKCRFLVGQRGSGKSTLMAQLMKGEKRLIVTTTVPRDFRRGFIQCTTVTQVRDALRANWQKGFKICLRMDHHDIEDQVGPVRDLHNLSILLRQVQDNYVRDIDTRRIHLYVDEITRQFPHTRPRGMDGFKWAILEGRNWGIDITVATQRPTLLPPDYRDNVDDLFVLSVGGDSALDSVVQYVGRGYRDRVRDLPKYQYLHFVGGQLIGQKSTKIAP